MKTILVPLDGSPFGEHALPAALAIARAGSALIDLVHVHQVVANTLSPANVPFFDPQIDLRLRAQEAAYLETVAAKIAAVWDGPVTRTVLDSPTTDALCKHAHTINAGLIVLSTHGRGGVARAWLGSVADRVIRQAKIPTLAIHPTHEPPDLRQEQAFEHILIPLDGSLMAEQVLDIVDQIRGGAPAHYDLVRVIEPITHGFTISGVEPTIDVEAQEVAWQYATQYLERLATSLRERGNVVMTYAPIGHLASAILERADSSAASLIAMTTHGRSGLSRMVVGSVADKVLRGTTRPVLIYRPPEGVSA